jgi:transcriptional regulator
LYHKGENMPESGIDIMRGTLDLLVLTALRDGPRHGYAIAQWIDLATDADVYVDEGTLYPALHRIERKGWVRSELGRSASNRRARYYELTPTGRAHLNATSPEWLRQAEAIVRALRAAAEAFEVRAAR